MEGRILCFRISLLLLAGLGSTVAAQTKSTIDVLDRHLRAFRDYDLEARLAAYPSNSAFFVRTGLLRVPDAIKPFFEAVVSEDGVGQAALRPELVRMWGGHNSAIVGRRTTVDAGYPAVVGTSMIEQHQQKTGLHRVLL